MEVADRTGGFDGTSRALGILKEIGSNAMEELSLLMPNLLSFLKHDDPVVVRQSITTGTSLFSAVLTEMALQLRNSNKVEGWLEEMWSWMLQFKDAVRSILEPRSTGSKVLAAKFLENCFLLFTSDVNNGEEGKGFNFSIMRLVHGHPTLNATMLAYEANKILNLFLDILQSATLSTSLVVTVINCLASIAKKRPVHYNHILSILLDFDPNFQTSTGGRAASIQYAVRIALLGLLRCRHASKFESRDELLTVLLDKYPGDATKSFIRRMEKIYRAIEGNPHDTRLDKVDLPSSQFSAPVNLIRSRPLVDSADASAVSDEMPSKRPRLNADEVSILPVKGASDVQDTNDAIDNSSLNSPPVSSDLSPAEKMIVAIGALLAEGDKGVPSLDLLLSQIHPELLADIVIETMKHLPKSLPVSPGRTINIPPNSQTSFPSTSQAGSYVPNTASSQSSPLPSVLVSAAVSSNGINTQASDIPSVPNLVNDVKRDPRRDPRRLDPRRSAAPVGESSTPLNSVGINDIQGLLDSSNRPTTSGAQTTNIGVQTIESAPTSNAVLEFSEKLIDQAAEQQISGDNLESINETVEKDSSLEGQLPSDLVLSPVHSVEQESTTSLEISENEGDYDNMLEPDMTLSSEDVSHDLPVAPLYVEQTNEQKKALCQLAMTRLMEDYKQIQTSGRSPSCLSILARLVAQSDADDDLVTFFRKHIVLDYHRREGHDLSMHVLYHLYAVTVSDLDGHSPLETNNYEKFLLAVAKSLLDSLPASDKSFSRLLGEAPFLTESAFKMLEDLCQSHGYENHKDACDGDRVSQGLGALWSLILGRPVYRQTCLDIALKCSVHSHDEVRAKAIRLVANKLFLLPYASERIEKFAQSMLFSVVDQHVSEAKIQHPASSEQMKETGSQETSVSHSHNSDIRPSENETIKDKPLSPHSVPTTPLLHAQRQTSLFFALCTKKPSLLHLVFDVYGRAPKVVRQSIHRHIPGLIRTLGPSDPKLLQMISEPPEGSENLITLVLQLMTEESTPSADLIASVKHLYDTKLKDVTILIPLLSSLSKDEVLPIFPRLVNLPLEKFQDALARILQGSAHTGPALTPVEVLVAIHDVDPVKHGVALKKITDACTACFEQRTVFTQHVLAKSLSHMVEQVPLPMLFMRTVIQAIGAFPTLIDFVMGILSKLVEKQIWKMPKLWVGFLKLVSQTHPHSFNVLLQLPPPQLENALNKYANLRSPLAAYANQPNIRTSLSRQTLQVLGLTTQ